MATSVGTSGTWPPNGTVTSTVGHWGCVVGA